MRTLSAAIVLFVVMSLVTCAPAQSTNASITGYVTDVSKAVIIDAKVSAINTGTNFHYESKTNSEGTYNIVNLPPGTYRIEVERSGFRTVVKPDVMLHVQDSAAINFEMAVGSTSEVVTVTGGAPIVNTQDASVGTVIDRQFVANMPLNGRSFQSLVTLTPGVVITTSNSNNPGQFSINGQRADSNYFTIDGVGANVGVAASGNILAGATGSGVGTTAGGGYNNLVSIDDMQEFKIQTSSFAPEFGRSPGGQVSIVTRSGTNYFHGDAFDYLRNDALDANDWIANSAHIPRQGLHQNDFGGVLGGPVWRNKIFFFASYEGLRLTQPINVLTQVPSVAARTTSLTPDVEHPYLNAFPQPTPGGCGSALAPLSPTVDPNGVFAPFCEATPGTNKLDATSIRGDWNINSKMNAFVRWNYAPSSSTVRNRPVATSLMINNINTSGWTAGHTYSLTSNIVNDFRFNYTFVTGFDKSVLDSFGGAVPVPDSQLFPSNLTIPGLNAPVTAANSRVFFLLTQGNQWRVGDETKNASRQWNYIDSISVAHGPHQIKVGADFRRLTPVQARAGYQYSYQFTTPKQVQTGNGVTFLAQTNPYSVYLWHNLSFFGQDTWKITPRLTLTYGLRWDYNPPPSTETNVPFFAFSSFDPNNIAATVVAPIGTQLYNTPLNTIQPRIGVAYQLSTDPNWGRVLRAGWGIFHDTTGAAAIFVSPLNGATTGNLLVSFPATTQLMPPLANNNPPFTSVSALDPNLKLPTIYEMNAALEQSLGAKQALTLTYAGAIGRDLFLGETFLPPAGSPSRLDMLNGYTLIGNFATSDYHSLQVLFQRQLSHGIQAMASYVWSHSIDTGSSENNIAPNFTLEPLSQERGNSDFDIRHSVQTAISYDIPYPRGNAFLRNALGYWGTDVLFRARTAPPVNVTDSNAFFAQYFPTLRIAQRPNLVPGVSPYLYNSSYPGGKVLNPAAFANQCGTGNSTQCVSPTQGTLPRNYLRDFPWNQIDLTLRRDFPIHESVALQFRADLFNILNHPNFSFQPGSNATVLNVAGGNFGRSVSMLNTGLSSGNTGSFNPLYQAGGPRSIQFSLKLKF